MEEYGSLSSFVHLQDVLAESVLFTPILQTFVTLVVALSPMDSEKEK
jgi:hypothetical protein